MSSKVNFSEFEGLSVEDVLALVEETEYETTEKMTVKYHAEDEE